MCACVCVCMSLCVCVCVTMCVWGGRYAHERVQMYEREMTFQSLADLLLFVAGHVRDDGDQKAEWAEAVGWGWPVGHLG